MTKQQRQEKQDLIAWLEEHDQFELLGWDDEHGDPPPQLRKLRRLKTVVLEIKSAIKEAAQRIKKLERAGFGIGDTATDEAIAGVFYSEIH